MWLPAADGYKFCHPRHGAAVHAGDARSARPQGGSAARHAIRPGVFHRKISRPATPRVSGVRAFASEWNVARSGGSMIGVGKAAAYFAWAFVLT